MIGGGCFGNSGGSSTADALPAASVISPQSLILAAGRPASSVDGQVTPAVAMADGRPFSGLQAKTLGFCLGERVAIDVLDLGRGQLRANDRCRHNVT